VLSFSFGWGGCKDYVEGLRAPLGLAAGVARFVGIGLGEGVRGGVVGLANILPVEATRSLWGRLRGAQKGG